MKKSFKSGTITGILIGILSGAILVGGIYLATGQGAEKGQNDSTPTSEKLQEIETLIKDNYLYEVDSQKVEDSAAKAMVAAINDPYGVYYNEKEAADFINEAQGEFCGVGATIAQNKKTMSTKVMSVYDEGSAKEAGMKVGDILRSVDGVDVTSMKMDTIVGEHILGKEGTSLTVTLYRPSTKETLNLTMKRKLMESESVHFDMVEDKVACITISEFNSNTVAQFRTAIKSVKKQKAKGLIFDLRNNPGGDLNAVVEMLGDILPDGVLVYTEDKQGERSRYYSKDGQILIKEREKVKSRVFPTKDRGQLKLPMAVLVNKGSASGAELFAQALKDYQWATIIGTKSFGKGIVQEAFDMGDGTIVKLTISSYFTKSGVTIQGKGVIPDIKVKQPASATEDLQLQKAVKVVR